MHVVVMTWDLSRSKQTIDSLREYLREESVDTHAAVSGLRLKVWISDPDANRWGAIYLWESREAASHPVPSRASQLIGYPPSRREEFDVEATVEGQFALAELSRRGCAYEG